MGVILAQEDAAGIGEAGGNAGEKAADFPEGVALLQGEGMAGFLGAGQVAHEQADVEAFHRRGLGQKRSVFADGKAEAVDARIDMNGAGKLAAIDPSEGRPFARFLGGDEGGQQIVLGIEFRLAGEQAVEHVDGCFGENPAQFLAFLGAGHEEAAAARFPQGAAHGLNAQAIGIALDRRAAFGRAGVGIEGAPVLLDRAQVD